VLPSPDRGRYVCLFEVHPGRHGEGLLVSRPGPLVTYPVAPSNVSDPACLGIAVVFACVHGVP